MDSVLRSGSLPHYTLFHGDHSPYYLDLDATRAFSDSAHEIHWPVGRALHLHDPQIVIKYKDHLHKQLEYHKIIKKHDALIAASESGEWSSTMMADYQNVDHQVMKAMNERLDHFTLSDMTGLPY
jgi:hypothetical protein